MKNAKILSALIYIYIIVIFILLIGSFYYESLINYFGLLIICPTLIYLLNEFFLALRKGFKSNGVLFFKEILINIFYLIGGIVLLSVAIAWYFLPIFIYFKKETSIYYRFCLPLLGGVIGEVIWIALYAFGWGYIGYKVAKRIQEFFKRLGVNL